MKKIAIKLEYKEKMYVSDYEEANKTLNYEIYT